MNSKSSEKSNRLKKIQLAGDISPRTIGKLPLKVREGEASSSAETDYHIQTSNQSKNQKIPPLNKVPSTPNTLSKKGDIKEPKKSEKLCEIPEQSGLKTTSSIGLRVKFDSFTQKDMKTDFTCKDASLLERANVKGICQRAFDETAVSSKPSKSKITTLTENKPCCAKIGRPEISKYSSLPQLEKNSLSASQNEDRLMGKPRPQPIQSEETPKSLISNEAITPIKSKLKRNKQKLICEAEERAIKDKPDKLKQKIDDKTNQEEISNLKIYSEKEKIQTLNEVSRKPTNEKDRNVSDFSNAGEESKGKPHEAIINTEKFCSSENLPELQPCTPVTSIVFEEPITVIKGISSDSEFSQKPFTSEYYIQPSSRVNTHPALYKSEYFFQDTILHDSCSESCWRSPVPLEKKEKSDFKAPEIRKDKVEIDITFKKPTKAESCDMLCVPLIQPRKQEALPCPYVISEEFEDISLESDTSLSKQLSLESHKDLPVDSSSGRNMAKLFRDSFRVKQECSKDRAMDLPSVKEESYEKQPSKSKFSSQSALGLVSAYDDISQSLYEDPYIGAEVDILKPRKQKKEKRMDIREKEKSKENLKYKSTQEEMEFSEEEEEKKPPSVKIYVPKSVLKSEEMSSESKVPKRKPSKISEKALKGDENEWVMPNIQIIPLADHVYKKRSSELILREGRDKREETIKRRPRKVIDEDRYAGRRFCCEIEDVSSSESSSSEDDRRRVRRRKLKRDRAQELRMRPKPKGSVESLKQTLSKTEQKPCHRKKFIAEFNNLVEQKSSKEKRICCLERNANYKKSSEHVCDMFKLPTSLSKASIHEKGSKCVVFKDEIEEFPSRIYEQSKVKGFLSKLKQKFSRKKSEPCFSGEKRPPHSIMKVKLNIDLDKYNPTICIDSSNLTDIQKKEAALILSECSKCFTKLKKLSSLESFSSALNIPSSDEGDSKQSSMYSLGWTVVRGEDSHPNYVDSPIKSTSERKFHAKFHTEDVELENRLSNIIFRSIIDDIINAIENEEGVITKDKQ